MSPLEPDAAAGQERPEGDRQDAGRQAGMRHRNLVVQAFRRVEDIVYIGLGCLLALSALVLLGDTGVAFGQQLMGGKLPSVIVGLLERLLLVLMIVELLYTVQVSFREHALVPEPFLIIGLVAAIRRILVLTAEVTGAEDRSPEVFRLVMTELGVLTVMVLVLVASLQMLRGRRTPVAQV